MSDVKSILTIKRATFILAVTFLVIAISLVGYQVFRGQIAQGLLRKIDRLVLQTPDGMTDLQWQMLVYHTHNLHCSATPQIEMSITELRTLHNDLDRMLASGPTRDSIDYLWDEYSRLSPGGAQHREVYESDRDARIAAALRDGDAYFDRASYNDFADAVRATQDE